MLPLHDRSLLRAAFFENLSGDLAEPGPFTFQTLSGQHLTLVSSYLTHDPWNDLKRLLAY